MLHVCLTSGQKLASVNPDELTNVKALKVFLESFCDVSRFRQRLVLEGEVLDDKMGLEVLHYPAHMQLVLLPFCNAPPAHEEELEKAVRQANIAKIEEILERPQDPNVGLHHGWSRCPLVTAAQEGNTEVIQLLLSAGANKDGV